MVEVVTTATDFHITDLRTLEAMLLHTEPSPARFSFEGSVCSRLASLSITLSQPLAFFQAIEAASSTSQNGDSSNLGEQGDHDVTPWFYLPSRPLIQLPRLRKLHAWLDHNGRESWSVVNERAILAPIEALKTNNPRLEVVCVLPKVHSTFEDRQRHYVAEDTEAESSAARVEVHRALRQVYRVVDSDQPGGGQVIVAEDIPRRKRRRRRGICIYGPHSLPTQRSRMSG